MTRERQLAGGREYAHLTECARILGGQHEDRLRKVHLAGDLLHELRVQALGIRKYRERIAEKAALREHVESMKSY